MSLIYNLSLSIYIYTRYISCLVDITLCHVRFTLRTLQGLVFQWRLRPSCFTLWMPTRFGVWAVLGPLFFYGTSTGCDFWNWHNESTDEKKNSGRRKEIHISFLSKHWIVWSDKDTSRNQKLMLETETCWFLRLPAFKNTFFFSSAILWGTGHDGHDPTFTLFLQFSAPGVFFGAMVFRVHFGLVQFRSFIQNPPPIFTQDGHIDRIELLRPLGGSGGWESLCVGS